MSRIGIMGGSGLYKIEGIKNVKEISIDTPFGRPSDKFIIRNLEDKEVVFLPRHGIGHRISPSVINYRANIYGMKKLKVERIISMFVPLCNCGENFFFQFCFVTDKIIINKKYRSSPACEI